MSAVIITWINYLYLRSVVIPVWPIREIVKESMHNGAKITKRFQPSLIVLRCSRRYRVRLHTTVKCLLAMAHGGGFTFVSALCPGKTYDREMVSRSGLLKKRLWESGDECLADHCFTVFDLSKTIWVKLRLPSFLPGQDQLSAKKNDNKSAKCSRKGSRWTASLKIKCFQIFSQPLPLKMAGSLNQLV